MSAIQGNRALDALSYYASHNTGQRKHNGRTNENHYRLRTDFQVVHEPTGFCEKVARFFRGAPRAEKRTNVAATYSRAIIVDGNLARRDITVLRGALVGLTTLKEKCKTSEREAIRELEAAAELVQRAIDSQEAASSPSPLASRASPHVTRRSPVDHSRANAAFADGLQRSHPNGYAYCMRTPLKWIEGSDDMMTLADYMKRETFSSSEQARVREIVVMCNDIDGAPRAEQAAPAAASTATASRRSPARRREAPVTSAPAATAAPVPRDPYSANYEFYSGLHSRYPRAYAAFHETSRAWYSGGKACTLDTLMRSHVLTASQRRQVEALFKRSDAPAPSASRPTVRVEGESETRQRIARQTGHTGPHFLDKVSESTHGTAGVMMHTGLSERQMAIVKRYCHGLGEYNSIIEWRREGVLVMLSPAPFHGGPVTFLKYEKMDGMGRRETVRKVQACGALAESAIFRRAAARRTEVTA